MEQFKSDISRKHFPIKEQIKGSLFHFITLLRFSLS